MLLILNDILTYLYKNRPNSKYFALKMAVFKIIVAKVYQKLSPKIENLGQSDPKNCLLFILRLL